MGPPSSGGHEQPFVLASTSAKALHFQRVTRKYERFVRLAGGGQTRPADRWACEGFRTAIAFPALSSPITHPVGLQVYGSADDGQFEVTSVSTAQSWKSRLSSLSASVSSGAPASQMLQGMTL